VRKQQGSRLRKTDWLDAAAICALLAPVGGLAGAPGRGPASALRPLWSGRKDLVDARGGGSRPGVGGVSVAGILRC
jgi:hypothetical protein